MRVNMDMDAVFSLPAVLGVALFVGIVTLVKLLLSPDGAFERRSHHDRRRTGSVAEFPLYDSGRERVTDDRRSPTADRRSHKFIITIQKSPTSH